MQSPRLLVVLTCCRLSALRGTGPISDSRPKRASLPAFSLSETPNPMRLIVGISLVLIGVGSVLCEVECESAGPVPTSGGTGWVRTTDGWECPQSWHADSASQPRIHPLVVAAGQGLVSIFALVACHGGRPLEGGSRNAR
jgi:hypothetical protein